jgi:anthraniloyl-CoA monooxygenase
VIDVSSAGNSPESKPQYGRMYQVPFAERIRYEVGIPVMAVGADLVALARPHLSDPHFTLHAAVAQGYTMPWPPQYFLAGPLPPPPAK